MNSSSATASSRELKPFNAPCGRLLYYPRFSWLKDTFFKYFGNKYFAYSRSEKQKMFISTQHTKGLTLICALLKNL